MYINPAYFKSLLFLISLSADTVSGVHRDFGIFAKTGSFGNVWHVIRLTFFN